SLARRRLLGLAGAHRLAAAAARAGVGLGALPADRQVAPVAEAAVRADLRETLDVGGQLAAQLAFHLIFLGDQIVDEADLALGEVLDPGLRLDGSVELLEELGGVRPPDPVEVPQSDVDPLVLRQIHSRDACHALLLSLSLLMFGVRAKDAHDPAALDD